MKLRNLFRNRIIFGLVLVLLLFNSVLGLGVTPGRTTINYEPGLEREVSFSILNNEHKNMKVFLTVQGELNQSVTLFDGLVEFMPNEESKSFKYKIKLPTEIAGDSGLHRAEIVALEVPESSVDGVYVGATVAVVSQLHVQVPCPGKCIETDLNILDSEENTTATFIVPILNRGKLGIGDARAIIDVYNGLNEKIDIIDTDFLPIGPGERTELSGKWEIIVPSGNYLAKVTVFYDGESKSFEKEFLVGSQKLSIESILVNNFRLGEIAKLQILVENKFDEELKSVFANLLVYNEDNRVMADVRSATETILPLSKTELIAYWDTIGVEEGEYGGKLMVRYGEKSTDKNLVLKVSEDSLDIFGVGYAIRPDGGKGIDITFILTVLVVILLVANLSWFIFFRRYMKRGFRK
jgi:hypothetical protein